MCTTFNPFDGSIALDLLDARASKYEQRMALAQGFKDDGNELFSKRNYFDADLQYEKTLSVFKYLHNTNTNWRNQVSL